MNDNPRFYILIGDENTWKISFSKNIWGFSEKTKGSWNTSQIGDYLVFYVTSPVKKIIGFGSISEKFIDDDLFWPDEKIFRKSLWKYRLRFKTFFIIENWKNGIECPKNIMLNQGRKVIDIKLFFDLVRDAESKWNNDIKKKIDLILDTI